MNDMNQQHLTVQIIDKQLAHDGLLALISGCKLGDSSP